MHVDRRVRQRVALALAPAVSKTVPKLAVTPTAMVLTAARSQLHGVIDRHPSIDLAAGRVYIQLDVLIRVFAIEEQQLATIKLAT